MEKKERKKLIPKKDWSQFNGPAFLVAVVRSVDPVFRTKLLASLRKMSPLFAGLVDQTEFIYTDLARVETRSLEKFWGAVSENEMAVAWKLTEAPLQEHLLAGLSERRRGDFLALCLSQPKLPRRQVIRIQQNVAKKAHSMACKGHLSLTSRRFGK